MPQALGGKVASCQWNPRPADVQLRLEIGVIAMGCAGVVALPDRNALAVGTTRTPVLRG